MPALRVARPYQPGTGNWVEILILYLAQTTSGVASWHVPGLERVGIMFPTYYRQLAQAAFAYPAIDNHAHPILTEQHRDAFPFEGVYSEAVGTALTDDSVHTLACYRSAFQLAKLYGLKSGEDDWEAVKKKRASLDYAQLCKTCMQPSGIQCILIDDGLSGDHDLAEGYRWHDQFTFSPTKRIVRIEVEAENMLLDLAHSIPYEVDSSTVSKLLVTFSHDFEARIVTCANDNEVVGFKSIACYRTGLDISTSGAKEDVENSLLEAWTQYRETGGFRLKHKALNDHLVRVVLRTAGQYKKPGFGDNDITLTKSSPAHMQPVLKVFPETTFVLLHAGYPYTRDAGYLTAVYNNVYLDFGQIFPNLSADGQRAVVKQILELSPTNKILWSSTHTGFYKKADPELFSADACWWPETYYLGSVQSRQVLYDVIAGKHSTTITLMFTHQVFADSIRREELTEGQAAAIVEKMLFHNSNRVYGLGLTPKLDIIM
ncbi:amidohydrolase 2 [Pisolithus marmoratus]|nr:amidohydrolase 2 [Pisolithus marmoratus]